MNDHEKQARINFIDTLKANVDNDKLSDAEFREFVRKSVVHFSDPNSPSKGTDYIGPYGSGVSQTDR